MIENNKNNIWLPFEHWFTRLRMSAKAYFMLSLPQIVISFVVALVIGYVSLSSMSPAGTPLLYKIFGDPSLDEWPVYWVRGKESYLTSAGYRILGGGDTVFIVPKVGNPNKSALQFLIANYVKLDRARSLALSAFFISFMSVSSLLIWWSWPKIRKNFDELGAELSNDQHIRSSRLLPVVRSGDTPEQPVFSEELSKLGEGDLPLIRGKCGDQEFVIYLPRKYEVTHMLFLGSTGAGKTQSLFPMLRASIARGTKNVIYDVKGDFTSLLFDDDKVKLFAPFDVRSIGWCPFADLEDVWDCREFSEVLIPEESTKSPYFVRAPRDLLGSILYALMMKKQTSNKDLLHFIHANAKTIKYLLNEFDVTRPSITHIFKEDSTQTQGVLASLRMYCLPLDVLDRWPDLNAKNSFSFKQYIRDDFNKMSLILKSYPERERVAAPLLSSVYNIMFKTCLSRDESSALDKRIIFFFDELAQLNRMDTLLQLLTLARSKNIGIFAAIQDFGLLRSKYSQDLLETMLNNFVTLVAGRLNETNTLQWLEKRFGTEEYWQYQEGHSFGPEDFADRLSAQRRKAQRQVVLSSEIATLPNLTYYILVDQYLCKASRKYEKFEPITEPNITYSFGNALLDQNKNNQKKEVKDEEEM